MNYDFYHKKINKKTTDRYDLTPLFENSKIFKQLIEDLTKNIKSEKIDKIAGLDATGFILGSAIAIKMGKGFVAIRKKGKYPLKDKDLHRETYTDYTHTEKTIEIKKNSIKKKERILIVDDWIETGGVMSAAIKLIERSGGKVEGITTIHCSKEVRKKFEKYDLKALNLT